MTPSHWLAGLVKQSFLKEYPVEVIHNGIDLNVFKPTPSDFRKRYHLEDKKIILGVASPWTPRKGLKDFIKLAKLLDEETRIVLVGLNDKQIKSLPENIIGIKRTNNPQELAGIYTTADVFFNPTYEDNYPTTNLEALACGTPVVTYNTGGSPECLRMGQGSIVEKGDLESACEKCLILNGYAKMIINRNILDKMQLFKDYISLFHTLT